MIRATAAAKAKIEEAAASDLISGLTLGDSPSAMVGIEARAPASGKPSLGRETARAATRTRRPPDAQPRIFSPRNYLTTLSILPMVRQRMRRADETRKIAQNHHSRPPSADCQTGTGPSGRRTNES